MRTYNELRELAACWSRQGRRTALMETRNLKTRKVTLGIRVNADNIIECSDRVSMTTCVVLERFFDGRPSN